MKKLLFAAFAMAALSVSAQDGHSKAHVRGTTISAPIKNRPRPVVQVQQSPVQGIIPHATRVDNPLQMLNPLAPHEYGTGEENVSEYNDDPGQGPKNQKNHSQAFRLFSLEF